MFLQPIHWTRWCSAPQSNRHKKRLHDIKPRFLWRLKKREKRDRKSERKKTNVRCESAVLNCHLSTIYLYYWCFVGKKITNHFWFYELLEMVFKLKFSIFWILTLLLFIILHDKQKITSKSTLIMFIVYVHLCF